MFAGRYFCEREVELEEADVAIVLHFAEHGCDYSFVCTARRIESHIHAEC